MAVCALALGAAACGDGGGDGVVGAQEPPTFAVVSSDYTAASVSLLHEDGSMLSADFIHSGSASSGLVTALSGDLALPTRSGEPEVLTLIDRFRTDVITRVDPMSGEVLGQVKTHAPNGDSDAAAFSSNPQDYVRVGDSAWVSRFEPNTVVGEEHAERGNDLLRIDPDAFERLGRIGLGVLNGEGERENPDTGETETVTVFARPGSIVRLGDHLVVGLSRTSASFDAIGEGMVALVDTETERVVGVPLEGMQNCADVVPVPARAGDGSGDDAGNEARVIVACAGFYRGDPRSGAGLALLSWDGETLEVEARWHGLDDEDAALAMESVVSLGGTRVLAVETGQGEQLDDDGEVVAPATPDRAFVVDLETGAQRELFEAEGRFVIGSGAYDADTGLLMVPDASTDDDGVVIGGVRRFSLALDEPDAMPEELGLVEVHDILPPRQVRAL